ncbi:MAG: hypothetical protein QM654_15860 [Dysgonamonadaceae bacterium]
MKKKLLGGIAVAAIAFAIAFNFSVKQDSNKLSALALDNVEALGDEFTPPTEKHYVSTYVFVKYLNTLICAAPGKSC